MVRYLGIWIASLCLAASSTAFATPEPQTLSTIPEGYGTASPSLVPVDGRIVFRLGYGRLPFPELSVSINDEPAEAVEVDLVGYSAESFEEVFALRLLSLDIEVGDHLVVSSETLLRSSPRQFEVVAADEDPPTLTRETLISTAAGVSDVCCDDTASDACGVHVEIEFTQASDAYAVAYYELTNLDDEVVGVFVGHDGTNTARTRRLRVLHPGLSDSVECYSLVAVDLSENRTKLNESCLALPLEATCPEETAGPIASFSCSKTGKPISLVALVLLYAGIIISRKRRFSIQPAESYFK